MIIPVFNRLELLKETVNSVLRQSLETWELILSDDGSDPPTREYLAALEATDKRIRVLWQGEGTKGAGKCRNAGLNAAKGAGLMFLDSDDLLLQDCLQNRVEIMESERPEFDFFVFQSAIFFEHPLNADRYWNTFNEEDDLFRFLSIDVVWPVCGVIWKTSFLKSRKVRFREEALSYQDWFFHVDVLSKKPLYKKFSQTTDVLIRRSAGYNKISDAHYERIVALQRFEMLIDTFENSLVKNESRYSSALVHSILREWNRLLAKGISVPDRLSSSLQLNSDREGSSTKSFRFLKRLNNLSSKFLLPGRIYRKVFSSGDFRNKMHSNSGYLTFMSAEQQYLLHQQILQSGF